MIYLEKTIQTVTIAIDHDGSVVNPSVEVLLDGTLGTVGKPAKVYISISQLKDATDLTYDIILNGVSIRKDITISAKQTVNMCAIDLLDDCLMDANGNYYLPLDATDALSISVTSVDTAHDAAIVMKLIWEG